MAIAPTPIEILKPDISFPYKNVLKGYGYVPINDSAFEVHITKMSSSSTQQPSKAEKPKPGEKSFSDIVEEGRSNAKTYHTKRKERLEKKLEKKLKLKTPKLETHFSSHPEPPQFKPLGCIVTFFFHTLTFGVFTSGLVLLHLTMANWIVTGLIALILVIPWIVILILSIMGLAWQFEGAGFGHLSIAKILGFIFVSVNLLIPIYLISEYIEISSPFEWVGLFSIFFLLIHGYITTLNWMTTWKRAAHNYIVFQYREEDAIRLYQAAESSSPLCVKQAVLALGELKPERTFEELKEQLFARDVKNPDPYGERYHIYFALGRLGDERAIPYLEQAFEPELEGENYSAAVAAAKGLAMLGHTQCIEQIEVLIKEKRGQGDRSTAKKLRKKMKKITKERMLVKLEYDV